MKLNTSETYEQAARRYLEESASETRMSNLFQQYMNKVKEMNSPWLEENGYWYSNQSGNWYQKVYKTNSSFKDKSVNTYHLELVTHEDAIDSLTNGFLPVDLQALADYQHDIEQDRNH